MAEPDQMILASLLEWTLAMGADAAVADDAVDWLSSDRAAPGAGFELAGAAREAEAATPGEPARSRPTPTPAATRPPSAASPGRAFAAAAPGAAESAARSAARSAASLDDLRRALEAFDGCALKATAKTLCFFRGAAQAPLMIVGEAPGREEDLEGKPFVGRAGQLLDRMLGAAGWSEADVHITNIVYWRPPGNRTPTPQETELCRPFLERQIELVAPRALLLLGGAASKQILRTDEGILKVRGRWHTLRFGALEVATLASLHPAYLLRTPIAKRQAWRDLLSVRAALAR